MGTSFYGERASGHRALRRGRISIPGQTYLVTFTTHQRSPIFKDDGSATLMARSLHRLEIWKDTKLLAWTLMPDHLHLLITLSPCGDTAGRRAEGEVEYGEGVEEQRPGSGSGLGVGVS